MMTTSYFNGSDQVSSRSEIALRVPVETILEKIYRKHNHRPINFQTRRKLSLISEELALEMLSKVFNSNYVKGTLDGFIIYFINNVTVSVNVSPPPSSSESPVQCPRTPGKKSCRVMQGQYLNRICHTYSYVFRSEFSIYYDYG